MPSEAIRNKAEATRRGLAAFMESAEKVFEFSVDCSLAERIDYINAVIFPGLSRYRFYARFFLARIVQFIDYSPIKILLYRLMGVRIGKGVYISPDVVIDIHFPGLIHIADYAILGWGVHLFSHDFSGPRYRVGRIRIGKGSVIGGFTAIRGGVTVEDGVNIPHSSIVYKDLPRSSHLDSLILRKRAITEVHGDENHDD